MVRTVVVGAVVALLAAALAVWGGALGITTVWPVLLAGAIGLAVAPIRVGRVVAFAFGAALSWVALALRAGYLPDTGGARALVVAGAVLALILLAAVTRDLVSLWPGLVGYAAFAALYEPMYADRPTLFLTESPVALVTVLLAAGLGFAAVAVADLFTVRGSVVAAEADLSEEGAA